MKGRLRNVYNQHWSTEPAVSVREIPIHSFIQLFKITMYVVDFRIPAEKRI